MKNTEFVAKYGEEALKKHLENRRIRYNSTPLRKLTDRKYRNGHKIQIAAQKKKYGEEHAEEIANKNVKYYKKNIGQIKVKQKKYAERHKEEIKKYQKEYREGNSEKLKDYYKKWRKENPEKVITLHREASTKGGKYYKKKLKANQTGLEGKRNKVRQRDRAEFKEIQDMLFQKTVLHHSWINATAEYTGIAFVDEKLHQNGIIDVVQLLDGDISLFPEARIDSRGGTEW